MAIPASTIMIRMLDSCIRMLATNGMRKLFIDAVKGGDQGFLGLGKWLKHSGSLALCTDAALGFQKWAAYREVWHNV